MIFSKFLSRQMSFVIMLIAGGVFIAMAVYNLGFPVGEVGRQLLLVLAFIACLILAGLGLALGIRWVIETLRNK